MAVIQHIDDNQDLKASRIEKTITPHEELGLEVMRQFRHARTVRAGKQVGEYTLDNLLHECYKARDDQLLDGEAELREKFPPWAAMPVSIVAFKVNILVSLIRETLVDISRAPFIVEPTPEPEIPQDEIRSRMQAIYDEITSISAQVVQEQQAFVAGAVEGGAAPSDAVSSSELPGLPPEAVMELLKQAKVEMRQQVIDHAKQQARLLEQELYDKTTEGGYRRAVMEFADDFATYPYACMHGPFPTVRTESVWKDNKFTEETRVSWVFERVSPFDFYWTEDSTNTQDGTAVFIRKMVGYDYLYDCRELAKSDDKSGYRFDVIDELIEDAQEGHVPREWLLWFDQNPEVRQTSLEWSRGQSAEILIRYGRFSGYELKEMGFLDLEEKKLYETKIIMCGGQVIYCQINNNPSQYKRPVFTASFESRNNSIVGCGLAQKLLSLDKAYRATVNLALYNLSLASEPVTEVEVSRILQYVPDDWIEDPKIAPGMVVVADGDRMGNGSRAIKFTQIPTTTESALRLASYIFEQAHVISNIPAALHGQPVGSGANRTVRGLLTLQGNTLKPIQSALMNLDLGVIEPMVTLLYMLLVMYDEDFEYTGDAKIVAKGAASMVEREMDKQTAMENMQILGQLGELIPEHIRLPVIENLLRTADILKPGQTLSPPVMQQIASQLGQMQQGAPDGIPGQAPQPQGAPVPQEQTLPQT